MSGQWESRLPFGRSHEQPVFCMTVRTTPVPKVTADFLSSGTGPNLRTGRSRNHVSNISHSSQRPGSSLCLMVGAHIFPTWPLFPCIQSTSVGPHLQSDEWSPGGALQAFTCRFMEHKVHTAIGTSLKSIEWHWDGPGQHWLLLNAASASILSFQDRHELLSWTFSTHIESIPHTSAGPGSGLAGGLSGRARRPCLEEVCLSHTCV